MTRRAFLTLVAAAALSTGLACGPPETPAPQARPASGGPAETPAPVAVHVLVPDGASPEAEAWAEELRTAVTSGHGGLSLAETAEEASVVVRVDAVESGVEVTPEPEGEGEIFVMRGALVVDGSGRQFQLSYRGEARLQAEALARNLRSFSAEGGTAPVTPPPMQ